MSYPGIKTIKMYKVLTGWESSHLALIWIIAWTILSQSLWMNDRGPDSFAMVKVNWLSSTRQTWSVRKVCIITNFAMNPLITIFHRSTLGILIPSYILMLHLHHNSVRHPNHIMRTTETILRDTRFKDKSCLSDGKKKVIYYREIPLLLLYPQKLDAVGYTKMAIIYSTSSISEA